MLRGQPGLPVSARSVADVRRPGGRLRLQELGEVHGLALGPELVGTFSWRRRAGPSGTRACPIGPASGPGRRSRPDARWGPDSQGRCPGAHDCRRRTASLAPDRGSPPGLCGSCGGCTWPDGITRGHSCRGGDRGSPTGSGCCHITTLRERWDTTLLMRQPLGRKAVHLFLAQG